MVPLSRKVSVFVLLALGGATAQVVSVSSIQPTVDNSVKTVVAGPPQPKSTSPEELKLPDIYFGGTDLWIRREM